MKHFNIYFKDGNNEEQVETYLTAYQALWAYLDYINDSKDISELRIEKVDYKTGKTEDITAKVNKTIERL